MAFALAGCPPICRHVNKPSSFEFLQRLNIKVVIVDLPAATGHVDLTKQTQLELILTIGKNDTYQVLANCEILSLESSVDFDSPVAPEIQKAVKDYEPTANTQKILAYGTTSGSTGPPKIIVYKNEIPVDGEHYVKYPDSITDLGHQKYDEKVTEKFGSEFAAEIASQRHGRLKLGTMLNLEGIVAYDFLFPPHSFGHEDIFSNSKMDIYLFGFNTSLYGPIIEKYKINTLMLYTPFLMQVCDEPTFTKSDVSSLIHVCFLGAPVTRPMFEKIQSTFQAPHSNLPVLWEYVNFRIFMYRLIYYTVFFSYYGSSEINAVPACHSIFDDSA